MKKLTLTLLALTLPLTVLAKDEDVYGAIVSAPSSVKVRDEEGKIVEYRTPPFKGQVPISYKFASLRLYGEDGKESVQLGWGGQSKCPPYIGQLAEAVEVVIQDQAGNNKTITIAAASSEKSGSDSPGSVRVFGTCQGSSNQLDEITIETTVTNLQVK